MTFNVAGPDANISNYWDIDGLRGANSMNVRTPRVGVMTTPAFFCQWLDNVGDSARGITNQAIIGSLGRAVDGSDQKTPVSLASLDSNHAAPNTPCHSCHFTIDPMRQYYRQALTHKFHRQQDYNQVTTPGVWAKDGVSVVGTGLTDFATRLGTHPDVAMT